MPTAELHAFLFAHPAAHSLSPALHCAALEAVDAWARTCLERGGDSAAAPGLIARTLDRVLGVRT